MKKIALLLGGLMVSVSVMAAPVKLLVFGDSLSVGHNIDAKDSFWAQLGVALKKNGHDVQVVNNSKSGETTKGALHRIRGAIARKPQGVILQLGSNDMFQHFPLEATRKNLQTLITAFKKANIPVFLVGMEALLTEKQEYRDGVRQMYADLALENELLLYPFFMDGLWREDGTNMDASYFLEDKIHPSAKGVQEMVRRILPAIEQFLREDVQTKEKK